MPCQDGGDAETIAHLNYMVGRHEAWLCAVFRVLECSGGLDSVMNAIDWPKVSNHPYMEKKDVLAWWERHKDADARRELDEKDRAARQRRRAAALAKLNADERDALGIREA